MQWIGFPVTGASPAGAQVFDRVERDVGSGDMFPGPSRTVQEVQRDHQAILNEFSFVVATDTWNGVGNCISEPGLNFMEQQFFCGVIHQHGFCGGGLKRKQPLPGDLPSRGCLIGECESPGRAAVKPQSRKGKSGKAASASVTNQGGRCR